jgi:hypothetical protein
MNKLYKYLPFGIKGILSRDDYGNVINTTGKFVGYNDGIITMYDEERNPEFGEEKDFKPILRPFEDLTKELPLTKAAAEMVGMNEGELIYCKWLIDNLCYFDEDTEKINDFLRAMRFAVDFTEDEYIKLKD